MDLVKGKNIIITGASRGIGRGIALAFAKEGANVAFTYSSSEGPAKELEAELSAFGVTAKAFKSNAADFDAAQQLVSDVLEIFDSIDVLINNAGITKDNILMRMKEDEWQSVIDTNLTALYRLSKACLRGMTKARWGRIINVTSVVGSMGNAGQSNYAATKAGAEGMARSLARELGSRSVTVNCIAPGFIDTDMTRALADEQRDVLQNQIPLGRLGSPDDVAAAVTFLASDAAQYITGETLHVNGGLYMG